MPNDCTNVIKADSEVIKKIKNLCVSFNDGEEYFDFYKLVPMPDEFLEDERFWDDKYDTTHVGEMEIAESTQWEKAEIEKIYFSLPSAFSK